MIRGRVDLEHHRHVVDVDAPSGDVGRDEHREGALPERAEDAVPDALAQATVQCGREDALLAQLLGDPVGAELGADEHDGATRPVRNLGGDDLLVLGVDEKDVVGHRRDRGLGVVGGVGDGVGEVALDQSVDAAVEGGREEQPLAALRDQVEDRRDLGQEAHLGHVVGLVEDRDLDVAELDRAALEQVVETARSGDEEVDTAVQGGDLRRVAEAAGHELVP